MKRENDNLYLTTAQESGKERISVPINFAQAVSKTHDGENAGRATDGSRSDACATNRPPPKG